MRNRYLVYLFTIFFCGCSSPAQTLTSGDILWIGENRCSVSIAQEEDRKVALTVGHCGSVGSKIYAEGLEIGRVAYNYLDNENPRDISVLELSNNIQLNGQLVEYSQGANEGDKVFIGGMENVVDEFYMKSVDFSWGLNTRELSLQAIDYSGEPGESGAPVMVNGSLIGIVQGGNRKSTTYIEDIPEDLFSRV